MLGKYIFHLYVCQSLAYHFHTAIHDTLHDSPERLNSTFGEFISKKILKNRIQVKFK